MNPYKVLGVPETATKEEIRAAYLKLVKKYHPDKYTDNPLKELAGEKLKEINLAYDMLTKNAQDGNGAYAGGNGAGGNAYGRSTGAYGNGYSRNTGSTYAGPNAEAFRTARAYIQRNDLNAARRILDGIDTHNAEWNFLYGVIYRREGWHEKARACITAAYREEPDNPEYRYAYRTMAGESNAYSRTYSRSSRSDDLCTSCSAMLLCSLCTGGRLFFCC
ncbi:MAG: J domain-containing protein [Clostridia bacterium]|nr:J domain-containing protein [Clostridia bacterium]